MSIIPNFQLVLSMISSVDSIANNAIMAFAYVKGVIGNFVSNLRIFCSELLGLCLPLLITIANCGNDILEPVTKSKTRLAMRIAFSIRASKVKSLMIEMVLATDFWAIMLFQWVDMHN
ncbi:MAG: hypothetical protein EKK57_02075 [Proteobacteria bacterium]|nr:MAG: hypothetical protein EKK57_02075 [Pseudomonadota bacterium]